MFKEAAKKKKKKVYVVGGVNIERGFSMLSGEHPYPIAKANTEIQQLLLPPCARAEIAVSQNWWKRDQTASFVAMTKRMGVGSIRRLCRPGK